MKLQSNQLILIVEDSDDDYESTIRALKRTGNLNNPIIRCDSGQSAIDYLYQKGDFSEPESCPRPGLILLDLNMPGMDGRMVLKKLKTDDALKDIPVVVLTTSDNSRDIEACYKAGANTYIHKPVDIDGFFNAIKHLKEYWLEVAILPKSQ